MRETSTCTDDELRDWLRLTLTDGLGPASARKLLAHFGLPDQVLGSSHARLAEVIGEPLARLLLATNLQRDELIERCLDWSTRPDRHLLTLADDDYPARLLTLTDPPPVLYARGRVDRLSEPAIAIVGSRHASVSGAAHAEAFAQALAQVGWTIASGLAAGIDAAAHRGALAAGEGATVAVIGNGPDQIYPRSNVGLARRIADAGVIVSELPPGSEPKRGNFPRRNRIIAGLSVGVLVVEAAPQSGSLITARLAAESGREVFAIPGSIDAPLSKGCHALIKQGAKLVETIEDILGELEPGLVARTGARFADRCAPAARFADPAVPAARFADRGPPATADAEPIRTGITAGPPTAEEAAILKSLGWDPLSAEHLAARCRLPAGQLAGALLRMELAGRVERLADGRYRIGRLG